MFERPKHRELTVRQRATEELAKEELAKEEPAKDEPAKDEPASKLPANDVPAVEDSAADESSLEVQLDGRERSGQQPLFDPFRRRVGRGEYRGLEFLEVEARTIINKIPGPPRFGFQYSINAYRGCSHACNYCFARPTHEFLGLNAGTDFDSKIVVKVNAVELARAETAPGRWTGDLIAMGTNTDPYQPAEGKYRLTRGIIEVLAERENPLSILTKSSLVLRDLQVLAQAASTTKVRVDFSVGTLDETVWKETEPGTPHPRRRLEAVAKLNDAGVRSGVLIGPVLPGRSDRPEQIEEVVKAAVDAGAVSIGAVLLHLKPGVKEHYLGGLAVTKPELVNLHRNLYGGNSYATQRRQADLSEMVKEFVAKHGGPEPRRFRSPADGDRRATLPIRSDQLSLGV